MKKIILIFALILGLASPSFAAVTGVSSATIVWELRSDATAANANGCGYDSNATIAGVAKGTDWSQQTGAKWNLTGVTTSHATNPNILLHADAAADMVGNVAHIISGTNANLGWYLITAADPGVSITVAGTQAAETNDMASGVVNIGGACSMGSSTTNQTDANLWTAGAAGNTYYLKSGAFTLAASSTSATGTTALPVTIIGYITNRTTIPTGTDRPSIAPTAGQNYSVTFGAYNTVRNLIISSASGTTAQNLVTTNTGDYLKNVKIENGATGTTRSALALGSSCRIVDCEIATHGTGTGSHAITVASGVTYSKVIGSYIHGISGVSGGACLNLSSSSIVIGNSIIGPDCTTYGVAFAANANTVFLYGNTFFGPASATPTAASTAIGVYSAGATADNWTVINNIFYGWASAIQLQAVATSSMSNWNDYYNNTVSGDIDNAYIVKGPQDLAVDPQFVSAPTNLAVGTNVKALGIPGTVAFNGLATTRGYMDIGAVQRVEPGGGGGGSWSE